MGAVCAAGCCASGCVSCLASATCSVCCSCLPSKSTSTRLNYAVLLAASSLLSLIMLSTWAKERINDAFTSVWFDAAVAAAVEGTNTTAVQEHMNTNLLGALAIHRIMTGQIAFHALIALALMCELCSSRVARTVHEECWIVKYLVWAGSIAIAFVLVPNRVFQVLAEVYRVGGALFLLWQCVLYIAFVNRFWANATSETTSRRCWVFVAITCTTLSFAWSIFVLVTSVIVAADGCAVALAPAIAATVLTLLVSMLAISPLVRAAENGDGEQSGLFQASAVSAYCHYLVLSALLNDPDSRCRPFAAEAHEVGGADSEAPGLRALFCIFTLVAYCYTVTDTAVRDRRTGGTIGQNTYAAGGQDDAEMGHTGTYSYLQFHLTFLLGGMCLTMVLTGWDSLDQATGQSTASNLTLVRSSTSGWINRGAALACYLLYAASLLLPPLCPRYSFGSKATPELRP